jgi:hypothetical protein
MSKDSTAMPKGIPFEQIDKWFREVSSVGDRLRSQESVFALINLEDNVNGLILQWNRIMSDQVISLRLSRLAFSLEESWRASPSQALRIQSDQAFNEYWKAVNVGSLDVHFYLICWEQVNRRFEQLERLEPYPKIGLARRPVKDLLDLASKARGFSEHSDEKNKQGLSIGMSGDDELEFGYTDTDRKTRRDLPEKKVKLGKTEVRMIIKAYEEVVNALKEIDPKHLQSLNTEKSE